MNNKKSDKNNTLEKLVLITTILSLINEIIDFIKSIIKYGQEEGG